MAAPQRRTLMTRAARAEGEAALGVQVPRPRELEAPPAAPPAPADIEIPPPAETPEVPPPPPAPQRAAASTRAAAASPASPPTALAAVPRVRLPQVGETPAPWAGLRLPHLNAPQVKFTITELLAGPARPTSVLLPADVASALRQIKFECDRDGYPVQQGTLVAHALAYSYTHTEEWLHLVPVDGRRKGGDTNLSGQGRRTSFTLPDALRAATDTLLWAASAQSGEEAPAKITLRATGIAWGLSRLDQWLEQALGLKPLP
jgi:hypothetical protein